MTKLVKYIAEEVRQEALRHGVNRRTAELMAEAVEHSIRVEYGGSFEYVHSIDLCKRNKKIMDGFNGRNHDKVCREWGISRRTLQYIITDAHDKSMKDAK